MEYLNTLIDPETWIIVLIIIAFAGIAGTIHFALKLNEANRWDETQSSMYAKAIIRIADLQNEVAKLHLSLKEKAVKLCSQSIAIEMLIDELETAASSMNRKKLRREIAELTRLNRESDIDNNNLIQKNNDLRKRVDFMIGSELKLTEELVQLKEEIEKLKAYNIDSLDRIKLNRNDRTPEAQTG